MIGGYAVIVAAIPGIMGYYDALYFITVGRESSRGAGGEHKVGGETPFIIPFVIAYYRSIMQAVEAVGVPFSVIDAFHLAFRTGEGVGDPTGKLTLGFFYKQLQTIGPAFTT